MEHTKEDRRRRRTRQLLRRAFLDLLREKRYEAITVQDIINRAMAYTPERMDEIFQQLVMPGLYSALDITA